MTLRRTVTLYALAGILLASSGVSRADAPADSVRATPDSLTVKIGNRLYPEYSETVTAMMNERVQVGDTDYFFEAIEFYPHFAIARTDSTKKFMTLSDEPKNPAFRIRVYENDDVLEDTWAFYSASIPHFSRESFLYFKVLEFDYRGVVHNKELDKARKGSDEHAKESE